MSDPLFSSAVFVDPARAVADQIDLTRGAALALPEIGADKPKRTRRKAGVTPGGRSIKAKSLYGEALAKTGSGVAVLEVKAFDAATLDLSKLTMPSVVFPLDGKMSETRWASVRTFVEKVTRIAQELPAKRQEEAIAKLADVLLPDDLAPARGVMAADELLIRDRFLADFPSLTSQQVGKGAGLSSGNPYATANRWKKSGDIFSVRHRDVERYPVFQFQDGRPHPTIKAALAALPDRMSAWQRAFWFVSTNGWLDDRAPIDALDDPAMLIEAARLEGAEVIG